MFTKELTYIAEAQRFLESKAKAHTEEGNKLLASQCFHFAAHLEKSMKFALPDGALIIPGFRQSSPLQIDSKSRLPYETISIAYTAPTNMDGYVAVMPDGERLSFSDAFGVDVGSFVSCPKRVLLLHGIESDGEYSISMVCVWYTAQYKEWVLYPHSVSIYPERTTDGGLAGRQSLISGYEKYEEIANKPQNEIDADLADEVGAMGELLVALSCSNVESSPLDLSKLKRRRITSKISKRKLPFYEHRVLTLREKNEQRGTSGESHASPRCHLRRGHIRNLPDGRRVWVNACIVGDKSRGFVSKDYKVATA